MSCTEYQHIQGNKKNLSPCTADETLQILLYILWGSMANQTFAPELGQ